MKEAQQYRFEDLPQRIFFDTNIVNCLVKDGGTIFETPG